MLECSDPLSLQEYDEAADPRAATSTKIAGEAGGTTSSHCVPDCGEASPLRRRGGGDDPLHPLHDLAYPRAQAVSPPRSSPM